MRADAATAITALALTAGLVVVVGAMLGAPGSSRAVQVDELDPIRLDSPAHAVVGIGSERFLLARDAPGLVIDAAKPNDPQALPSMQWYGGDAFWDEQKSVLQMGGGGGVTELDLSDLRFPRESNPGSYIDSASFVHTPDANYVGTYNSQVFRIGASRTVEQKFNSGVVELIAAFGAHVVAFVRERGDDSGGTLYLLDGEELTLVAERPAAGVKRLLGVDGSHFLMLDSEGLHVGSIDGKRLDLRLEVAGVKAISRDAHDGFFVVSTSAVARLVRLLDGRATTVKTLRRSPILDAAFNDELLAVIYEKDKREVALYRLRL